MVKFAHISDTHLGYRQYNLEDREFDFYESFNETIDKILEERVDFVIHTGDLFEHYRPKVEALIQAMNGFKRLYEKGIFLRAIRSPTVPKGTERLRLTVMATHEKKDLDYLLTNIKEIGRDLCVI